MASTWLCRRSSTSSLSSLNWGGGGGRCDGLAGGPAPTASNNKLSELTNWSMTYFRICSTVSNDSTSVRRGSASSSLTYSFLRRTYLRTKADSWSAHWDWGGARWGEKKGRVRKWDAEREENNTEIGISRR